MQTKLYDYQEEAVEHNETLLRGGLACVLDGSDMGTGKTPTTVELLRRIDLPTVVVCPKVSTQSWLRWGDAGGASFAATGYEALRTGKSGFGTWKTRKAWLKKPDGTSGMVEERFEFVWDESVGRVVFDEAHRCSAPDSQNSMMLRDARKQGLQIVLVTATPAENPLQMRAMGFALDLHDYKAFYKGWIQKLGYHPGVFAAFDWTRDEYRQRMFMDKLHAQMWPAHGVRVRKTDPRVSAKFPNGIISVDLVEVDAKHELARLEGVAMAAWEAIQECKRTGASETHPQVVYTRTLQELEVLMVPSMVELIKEAVSKGRHCPVFVNYSGTIRALQQAFPKAPVIDGEHNDPTYRQWVMDTFQQDEHPVLLANSKAGGESISLHDLRGQHPREVFMLPGTSARGFKQVTGRADRAGAVSDVLTRCLVAAGSKQEKLKKSLDQKLSNIQTLVDGDLAIYN